MWTSFPAFGTALLLGVMIVASYTFAVALSAGDFDQFYANNCHGHRLWTE